jgi:regulator of protease activity HflC (stomatin/prohibitin superfamily)
MTTAETHAVLDPSSPWVLGVLAVLVLLVVAAAALRRVIADQVVVVVRRGRVQRVHESGLAWRIPVLERFEAQLALEHDLPVGVRATTRDGVPVILLVELTVKVPPPRPGDPFVDPWPGAELAAESVLADAVASWTVGGLPDAAAVAVRPLLRPVQSATREHGVESVRLELVEIDVPLL